VLVDGVVRYSLDVKNGSFVREGEATCSLAITDALRQPLALEVRAGRKTWSDKIATLKLDYVSLRSVTKKTFPILAGDESRGELCVSFDLQASL
jgi:hypothetical protein